MILTLGVFSAFEDAQVRKEADPVPDRTKAWCYAWDELDTQISNRAPAPDRRGTYDRDKESWLGMRMIVVKG